MLRIAAMKDRFDSPPVGAADLSSLIDELSSVLAELRDLRGSGLAALPPDGPVEFWEDDEHVYLEGQLPNDLGPDLDVSVHGDKVFIRIER